MSLSKLRALIHLANNSNEPGEAESAALQACRYIKQHGVQLTLGDAQSEPVPETNNHDKQFRAVKQCKCDGCEEPIEVNDLYWFKPHHTSPSGPHRRYHGGCV